MERHNYVPWSIFTFRELAQECHPVDAEHLWELSGDGVVHQVLEGVPDEDADPVHHPHHEGFGVEEGPGQVHQGVENRCHFTRIRN